MHYHEFSAGWIEAVVGPMFSGKSEELIRRVNRALIARQRVQVFKAAIDDRFDRTAIASHNGRKLEAIPVNDTGELDQLIEHEAQVVAIDECQFLDEQIVPLCLELADAGKRVILAGLDLDFRSVPFGFMPALLAQAEFVHKLTAICRCGRAAARTQRLISDMPAHFDDPVILVGAAESYEPRCRSCHVVMYRERTIPLFEPVSPTRA
jgi:thymidine kinase